MHLKRSYFQFMVVTLVLLVAECALGVWSIILWDEVDVESWHLMSTSFQELLNHDYDKKDWASLESEVRNYDTALPA